MTAPLVWHLWGSMRASRRCHLGEEPGRGCRPGEAEGKRVLVSLAPPSALSPGQGQALLAVPMRRGVWGPQSQPWCTWVKLPSAEAPSWAWQGLL